MTPGREDRSSSVLDTTSNILFATASLHLNIPIADFKDGREPSGFIVSFHRNNISPVIYGNYIVWIEQVARIIRKMI